MIRGTTPTHTFTLPSTYANTSFSSLYITFKQGETVVEKKISDAGVTKSGSLIIVKLTQTETLKFSANSLDFVRVQLRGKTNDGTVIASKIISISVEDALKEGEI